MLVRFFKTLKNGTLNLVMKIGEHVNQGLKDALKKISPWPNGFPLAEPYF